MVFGEHTTGHREAVCGRMRGQVPQKFCGVSRKTEELRLTDHEDFGIRGPGVRQGTLDDIVLVFILPT